MRCSRCLADNPAGVRFCGACGTRLETRCPDCGAWNPHHNRFCHACGTAIAPKPGQSRSAAGNEPPPTHAKGGPAVEAERKLVTVLFADLKGSLELIAKRDPEDARELLDAVTQCMVDAVRHFGGTVTHIMGDGIMALFGAPVAQEDHAFRACNSALRMQDTVARVGQQLQQRFGVTPILRVGLNSGEVVVRSLPADLHDDYSAIGPTTHLAARMEQISEPGKILISEETWRLVRSFVRSVPLGEVTVKGLAHPTRVFQLVGVTGTRLRFEAARARGLTPFVGRQSELARVRQVLMTAPRGQVVALVGDPGVGKSRLVWELTNALGAAGWLVLFGSAQAYAQASPYVVFRELLRHHFDLPNGLDPAGLAAAVETRLRAIDPRLAEYLPAMLTLLEPGSADTPFGRLPPEARKPTIREAVANVLLRESHRQPVLLVVEDLQWMDPESQGVLNTIVDRLPAGRASLLAVYRPEFHHEWGGLSYYTQLRIDPLPNQPARELLKTLVGQDPALDGVIDLMLAEAEGNPFFLEERVWSLAEQGALVGARGAYRVTGPIETLLQVPATVHALLAARIDRLPRDAKALLQTAAVVGRDVPEPLLHAVTAWPDARLEAALAHLEAAEFIYRSELSPDVTYSFRHALTHDVSYGSLLQSRRRELHADVLSALERGEGGRLGEPVERMAEHAVRGEAWPKAVDYLRRSGARAFAQSAHDLAARWFERALDALKRLPPSRDRTEQAVDLYLDLRYALSPLGEFRRILECLAEAEKLAHELGDQQRLGRITSYLSNHFQVVGELDRAIEYGERALETAAQEGDLGTLVVARSYLSLAYQTLGDYGRATSLARQNLEILGQTREREWFGMALLPAVYSRTALVRALAETGEFDEALGIAGRAVELSEQAQHPYSTMFALLGLGVVQLRRGLADLALPALQRSFQLCRGAGSPTMTALVGAFLASAHAGTGDQAAATRVLDEADRQAAAIGLTESTLPRALGLSARSEIQQLAGEFDEAVKSAEASREAFHRMGARGYEAWARWLTATSQARGAGANPSVEREFREALAQAEALGMRPLIARCHLKLGELLDHRGRPEEAQPLLTRARDELEGMGIPVLGAASSGRRERRS